ncbi:MAG: hypothetical protein LBD48_01580 [Treponema sp.]|jgi:hypothetical protein|nr:hypothetical protein [Treponema sp.]
MAHMVTIEIIDAAALRLLRDLAGLHLIRFASQEASEADRVTARLNEIYVRKDSSLDPSLMLAQAEACPLQGLGGEDW